MEEETKYEIKCNEYKKRDAKLQSEEESIKNQTKIDNIIKEEGEGGSSSSSQQKSPWTREKQKKKAKEKNVKSSSFRCYVFRGTTLEEWGEDGKRRAVWFIILKDPVASLYANYVRRIVILYSGRVGTKKSSFFFHSDRQEIVVVLLLPLLVVSLLCRRPIRRSAIVCSLYFFFI